MLLSLSDTVSPCTSVTGLFRCRVNGVILPIPCANQLAVGLSVSPIIVSLAVSALSVAIRPNVIQGVAPDAVRLAGIDGRWRVAAKAVLSVAGWSQMIRVHARRVVAEMVKFHPFGDVTDPHLVSETVGLGRAAIVAVKDTIAAFVGRAKPQPAIIRPSDINFEQESINGMHGLSITQASGYDKREED